MRVFLTGATGFIGSHIVKELVAHGHTVLGLSRSEEGAKALTSAGAEVQRGSLQDLELLKSSAAAADAVIHCGFDHDFSRFMENCLGDKLAIETLGSALAGSGRALIVSGGLVGLTKSGDLATEESVLPLDHPFPRVSEQTALTFVEKGVAVGVMRLSQIHNTVKAGLFSYALRLARETGKSAYVGDGMGRWAAAHVEDVARLYRLAVEKPEAGARWHAVAEDCVRFKDVAEVMGQGLNVPVVSITREESAAHFGWWAMLAGGDLTGSSVITRQKLGWNPTGPSLLEDLKKMDYSSVV